MIREFVDTTYSGYIKHYLAATEGKGKGNMVETEEFRPKNAFQTQIDLLMDEVNEYAEDKF